MKTILTALAMMTVTTQAFATPSGLKLTDVYMPHHDAKAGVTIWYPSGGGGEDTIFAENPVFEGVQAAMSAEVQDGQHPVVLFSHGMGGTTLAQAWLASALADRGAIVVSVNHAHSTWGDFDMTEGVKHWTRVEDLSVTLDAVLADPVFAGHVDPSRIMAAGFSFGGWTALSMGGLRGNLAGIVETCTQYVTTMEACDMLLSEKVKLQGLDPVTWNANYADPRVTQVAAIDPGFVWGLTAEDTATLVPNVLMIGLGAPNDRMSATDFDESGGRVARVVEI